MQSLNHAQKSNLALTIEIIQITEKFNTQDKIKFRETITRHINTTNQNLSLTQHLLHIQTNVSNNTLTKLRCIAKTHNVYNYQQMQQNQGNFFWMNIIQHV